MVSDGQKLVALHTRLASIRVYAVSAGCILGTPNEVSDAKHELVSSLGPPFFPEARCSIL